MRWLLFSDLHLRPASEAVCRDVMTGVLAKAQEAGAQRVGFLGDWWHEAEQLHVGLIELTRAFWTQVEALNGTKGRMLRGNHDTFARTQASALQVFERHAEVVHDALYDAVEGSLWIAHDKPDKLAGVLSMLGANPIHTVLMHSGLKGAWRNDKQQDTDGLDASLLAGRQVLLGHYHKPQDIQILGGKASYVGSAYQTRADEAGQQKRFLLWDSTARTVESIPVQFGAQFAQLTATATGDADLSTVTASTKVRATAPDETARQALVAKLIAHGVTDYQVTPQRVTAAGATVLVKGQGLESYMRAHVERRIQDPVKRAQAEALIPELLGKVT